MKTLRCTALAVGLLTLVPFALDASQSLMQEPGAAPRMNGRAGLGGGTGERIFVKRYPLRAAGSVTVENIQGDISVEAWDRAEAEVTVMKDSLGVAANAAEVRIDAVADGARLELRTLYPLRSDDPVRVSYRLRVPRQVRLERLRTVVGNIRVRNIEGSVDARTLNGSIEEINITGGVTARTLNGNNAVTMRSLAGQSAAIHLDTVNGHLFLGLPGEASAALSLATVAGRIDVNVPLKVSDTPGDTSWKANLGQGGTPIRMRTVRGNIHVAQSEEVL